MNSQLLFKQRLNEDIKRRTYYSKFIFNSHFLLFLTITIGVLVYSLVGYLQTIQPTIYLVIASSLLVNITLLPCVRTLLKRADGLYLLPYEIHMKPYFNNVARYSLSLGAILMLSAVGLSTILLLVGHDWEQLIPFYALAVVLYVTNYFIKTYTINSSYPFIWINTLTFFMSAIVLFSAVSYPLLLTLIIPLYILMVLFIRKGQHTHLHWQRLIEYEANAMARYYRTVSLFANVHQLDNQYKRRRYADVLLPNFRGTNFTKEKMYEFLFFRSFMRDNDLPMIIVRLLIISTILIIWLNVWYISIVVSLFILYVIVLQMSQIYARQAYLLWPKIWPVKRSYIQDSYIRYSNKLMVVIGLCLGLVFILIHSNYFYIAPLFPLWALLLNRTFSKSIYKKEQALSD